MEALVPLKEARRSKCGLLWVRLFLYKSSIGLFPTVVHMYMACGSSMGHQEAVLQRNERFSVLDRGSTDH